MDTKKTAWDIAPYLREEGIFSGEVIRIKSMLNADGALLLIRVEKTEPALPEISSLIPYEVYEKIYREKTDAAGSVKIGLYLTDWSYQSDDLTESGESEIETLLTHIRVGNKISFRMSKSWRGNKFYCRYIKNEDTGEWSGHIEESDWRQKNHPFPYYKEDGEIELSFSHIEKITDDYGQKMLSVEARKNDRASFGVYRFLVLGSSPAYEKLTQASLSPASKILCTVSIDKETGKSFITDADIEITTENPEYIPNRKRKSKRSEKTKEEIEQTQNRKKQRDLEACESYKRIKEVADRYAGLKNDEWNLTRGIYYATVIEDSEGIVDFTTARIPFVPLRLDDGRSVMPEARTSALGSEEGRYWAEKNEDLINLIKQKKYLYPGIRVAAYFGKNKRSDRMSLRGLYALDNFETIRANKKKWIETQGGVR